MNNHADPQDQWFAYAIAKHESRDGNDVYHEFYKLGSEYATDEETGMPLFRLSGPKLAGWGIMQLTFPVGAIERPTIAEIWDWQANINSGLVILRTSRQLAEDWMNEVRPVSCAPGAEPYGQRLQARIDAGGGTYVMDPNDDGDCDDAEISGGTDVAVDLKKVNDQCVFGGDEGHRVEDAITIKGYNGSSRRPTDFSGYYVAWTGLTQSSEFPPNRWQFTPINIKGFDYVALVCQEVDR